MEHKRWSRAVAVVWGQMADEGEGSSTCGHKWRGGCGTWGVCGDERRWVGRGFPAVVDSS